MRAPRQHFLTKRIGLWIGFVVVAASLLPAVSRAQSAIIAVDAFNRKVHIARSANDKRPVGGLAKIATAMVTLDWAEASNVGVNVLATVPQYALQMSGANPLGLYPGDRATLRDLICATMMSSDNVAAITLAHFVGADHLQRLGRQGDPMAEFVRQMNNLAAREGARRTHFTNPHGLENTRSIPYSTAADISRLAIYAALRPAMRFYTSQSERTMTLYRGEQQIAVKLTNTNRLLGTERIDGLKTGNTPRAGGCVVISADRPSTAIPQANGGSTIFRHRMVVVVIGSSNPFGEAQAILRQGWSTYDQWLGAGRPITAKEQLLTHY